MFRALAGLVPTDADLPARTQRLTVLRKVLDGTIYDPLAPFHEERTGGAAGEYVPLSSRAPSVRTGLCRVVVEDSVALTFSEGHFPEFITPDDHQLAADLKALAKATRLNEVMINAATRGSIGSVAIVLRILKGRVFFDVLETPYVTPVWRPDAPDTLQSVVELYKVRGHVLRDAGYAIDRADWQLDFWFRREWDANDERWFIPQAVGEDDWQRGGKAQQVDSSRSVTHGLSFVPIVWILNLPGGDAIDGACTFEAAIATNIEIDYQLSQAGRGLRYSSDPLLLIRDPAATDGELVKGGGNALVIASEKGDAKMLEISGSAVGATIDYARCLRSAALEAAHGSRIDPDRLAPGQSGRAMEVLNQPLVQLADKLRASYGEGALLSLIGMVQRASQRYPLQIVPGEPPRKLSLTPVGLRWPRWYPLTPDDRAADASTLTKLVEGGLMSRETALRVLSPVYDIEDVQGELARIAADKAAADARTAMLKATVTASETIEA